MELRSKVLYRCAEFMLREGECTADLPIEVPEETKKWMLETFPDWFEVVGESRKVVEKITTPEDTLDIETPERKAGKPRIK